jgi:pSer/pThr/pTyr-binding forkhead associated (FHA) protein
VVARGKLALNCIEAPLVRITLSRPVTILGRASSCDLVVNHPSVSRKHAELRIQEMGLQITDLGSRNGTFVASVRVKSCLVRLEEIVRFGSVGFILVDLASSSSEIETGDPNLSSAVSRDGLDSQVRVLSRAQKRVFQALIRGLSDKAIAKRLTLSPHTVHNHVRKIYGHLGVHSRSELLACLSRRVNNEHFEPTDRM